MTTAVEPTLRAATLSLASRTGPMDSATSAALLHAGGAWTFPTYHHLQGVWPRLMAGVLPIFGLWLHVTTRTARALSSIALPPGRLLLRASMAPKKGRSKTGPPTRGVPGSGPWFIRRMKWLARKRGLPIRTNPPPAKKSGKRSAVPGGLALARVALDARVPRHLPSPFPGSSYFVLRSRTTTSITADTAHDRIMVFGRFLNNDVNYGLQQTSALAWYLADDGTPPQVASWIYDAQVNSFTTGQLNASLHAMTLVVTSMGPANTACGCAVIGAFPARVGRDLFSTNYTSLTASAANTDLARRYSFYALMNNPVAISSSPLDFLSWDAMHPLYVASLGTAASTPSAVKLEDSLTPIFVLIPADGANAGSVQITIHCEWRLLGNSSSLYRNLHKNYSAPPTSVWNQITSAMQATGGFIHGAADAAAGLGRGALALANGLGQLRDQFGGRPGLQAIAVD